MIPPDPSVRIVMRIENLSANGFKTAQRLLNICRYGIVSDAVRLHTNKGASYVNNSHHTVGSGFIGRRRLGLLALAAVAPLVFSRLERLP
jgi:hypothetical protein